MPKQGDVKVVSLTDHRREHEWQRIAPLLKAMEDEFNARPPIAEELAEVDAIDLQLHAIECSTRAKLLLLQALNNLEAGVAGTADLRLKRLLENDPSVIYASDADFWAKHETQFSCMNARQRHAFAKRHKAKCSCGTTD